MPDRSWRSWIEFDYDGIDFDWEYPDTEKEVAGFERLTRRFRKELDELGKKKGRSMFVTMAASSNPGTLKWLDKAFLLETMDWINVMTYDYTGDWTDYAGHHSPLFASSKQPGKDRRSTESTMKYLLEERGLPGEPARGRDSAVRPRLQRRGTLCLDERRTEDPGPRGQLQQPPQARARPRLDPEVGRRDQEPLADLDQGARGHRLRRCRIGRHQDGMGHEAGIPRRLLLAGPRRPPSRRDSSPPGGFPQEMDRGGARWAYDAAFSVSESSTPWITRPDPDPTRDVCDR